MRKAFICPSKFVMGENELLNLGYFVKMFGKSALLIANPGDAQRVKPQLDETQQKYGVTLVACDFGGECSTEEVKKLQSLAKEKKCSCIIGLGGGKAIDTAKCVNAAKSRLIIVPTIAATDAPTSHSAVLYTPDGAFDDYAYFTSPDVVLIDTKIVAQAPVRFLVSGMGDALSTYFEARANHQSFATVNAGLPCGAREKKCAGAHQTLAAYNLAELCYDTLLEDGYKAKLSCEAKVVTPALENIIETNI
ncbi:MAG: iron-containing alcohol dehydrogenase, partial [Clostridia bacterium]